jgi:hypothetical protein
MGKINYGFGSNRGSWIISNLIQQVDIQKENLVKSQKNSLTLLAKIIYTKFLPQMWESFFLGDFFLNITRKFIHVRQKSVYRSLKPG